MLTATALLIWHAQRQIDLDAKLVAAVQKGDEDEVHRLLDSGANPNATDGPSAGIWAALLQTLHLRSHRDSGLPAVILATRLQQAMDSFDPEVSRGQVLVRMLLEHGANARARDTDGRGLLQFFEHDSGDDFYIYLLSKGADVNAEDELGQTPIFKAVSNGSQRRLKELIRRGADIMHRDKRGLLPCFKIWGEGIESRNYMQSIKLLLDSGLDVNVMSEHTTLLMNAAGGDPDLTRLLLKHGAVVNMREDGDGESALDLALTELYEGEKDNPYWNPEGLKQCAAILRQAGGRAFFTHTHKSPRGRPVADN